MTARLTQKIRSVTYPAYDCKDKKPEKKNPLQRMNSFDYSDESKLLKKEGGEEENIRRELSAEGRTRGRLFHIAHSNSTDTATSTNNYHGSSRHRSLRNSLDHCCDFDEADCTQDSECHNCGSFANSPTVGRGWDSEEAFEKNTERLLDWRKSSPKKRSVGRSRSYDVMYHFYRSPERWSKDRESGVEQRPRRRLCTSTSVPPLGKTSSSEKYLSEEMIKTAGNKDRISREGCRRRSQFRRALSVFSLTCSNKDLTKDRKKSKSPQKKILRPPTRHVYRKGLSGLPVECSQNYVGLAY